MLATEKERIAIVKKFPFKTHLFIFAKVIKDKNADSRYHKYFRLTKLTAVTRVIQYA